MSERLAPDVANYFGKKNSIRQEGKPIKEELSLKDFQNISTELFKITEEVAKISGTWNPVELYTADSSNIEIERQKVFDAFSKGEEYNPKFTYSYAKSRNLEPERKRLLKELHRLRRFGEKKKMHWKFWKKKVERGGRLTLDRPTRLFRTALYFKIKDDLATCDFVEGIKSENEDKIAKALKQKYPGTDQSLYDMAVESLTKMIFSGDSEEEEKDGVLKPEEKEFLKSKEFDAIGIKSAFEWALSKYGILYSDQNPKGFKVKIDPQATSIDVRDKSANGPTVFIPKDRKMNGRVLLGLIAHEIEGHARQSINGEKLFKIGGGALKIDNEQLYEGLGLRYEIDIEKKLFGADNKTPRPFYFFATRMAEEGSSFYQIFKNQVDLRLRITLKKPLGENLPEKSEIDGSIFEKAKKDAWLTTYRVMRGHIDTSNKKKFAMSKDLGYLRGYQMDEQLRENGLGFLNEEGVIASGALAILAELNLSEENMPIPFKDFATKYWEEVLKPQMTRH